MTLMTRTPWFAIPLLLILACTPIQPNGGVANSNDNAPPDSSGGNNSGDVPFADLVGTFHLADAVAAANLVIRADSTLDYDTDSCTATAYLSGRIATGTFNTLVSSGGAGVNFEFPCAVGADGLPALCTANGILITSNDLGGVTTFINGDPLVWSPGRVCTQCSPDGQSPTDATPCDCSAVDLPDVERCP